MGLSFAAVTALAFSAVVLAQTAKQPPDLSGVWQRPKTLSESDAKWVTTKKEPIPFQPWAQEIYEYGRDLDLEGEQFRPELNPRITECFPPDPNFVMNNDSPFDILQSPQRVLILFEWGHWDRQVWVDEEYSDDVDVAWMGYSIGKWDGDTLVIDTTHIDDRNSYAGFIHTEAMHIVERIRRVDANTLVNVRRFEDPKTYTKPWTDTIVYKLRPDSKIIAKTQCDQRYGKPVFYGE
jgi:hypothetical protein